MTQVQAAVLAACGRLSPLICINVIGLESSTINLIYVSSRRLFEVRFRVPACLHLER